VEIARLQEGRVFPISILMADIDNLKAINDSRGHAAGDELLKRTAVVLKRAFRAEDIIARIGGDEFAVVLPEVISKDASESIKRVISSLAQDIREHPELQLGLSLGFATSEGSISLLDVLKQADDRMYSAKKKHRIKHEKAAFNPRT
jgi:diguanylate cyclase (GGDEF)-like protein